MGQKRHKAKATTETRLYLLALVGIVSISFSSCKKNKRFDEAAKIVNEWVGKEIFFPENLPCYVMGKDTLPGLCNEIFQKEFKILLYVDSAGCFDCRLKLFEWKQLIEEAESLFPEKVGFLFYFQPKNAQDLSNKFRRDRFTYPVFLDISSEVNRLNLFPQAMEYQCFLLDNKNQVLALGNPVLNSKIWELYKFQIEEGMKEIDIIN